MAKKSRNLAFGALIAATTGYIVGILTAPKTGRQTRKDIAKNVSKAKTDSEKQLKKLHSETLVLIEHANKKSKTVGSKASKEFKDALEKANLARGKARMLLTALHDGDADDLNLQAVIEEISSAKVNLAKFIKNK